MNRKIFLVQVTLVIKHQLLDYYTYAMNLMSVARGIKKLQCAKYLKLALLQIYKICNQIRFLQIGSHFITNKEEYSYC